MAADVINLQLHSNAVVVRDIKEYSARQKVNVIVYKIMKSRWHRSSKIRNLIFKTVTKTRKSRTHKTANHEYTRSLKFLTTYFGSGGH